MNRQTRIILFLITGLVIIMFLVLLTVIKVPAGSGGMGGDDSVYPWIIFFPIFGGVMIPIVALKKKDGSPVSGSANRPLIVLLVVAIALVIAGLFFLFA